MVRVSGSSPTTVTTPGPVDEPADCQDRRWRWAIPVLVAVVALAVRLSAVLRGGGLYGYFGYDDGVYFAAAASLLAGRLPYQDFILLHPPGIVLALAPFAELGRLTTDRDAMAVARVVWLLVGALNAGLWRGSPASSARPPPWWPVSSRPPGTTRRTASGCRCSSRWGTSPSSLRCCW